MVQRPNIAILIVRAKFNLWEFYQIQLEQSLRKFYQIQLSVDGCWEIEDVCGCVKN